MEYDHIFCSVPRVTLKDGRISNNMTTNDNPINPRLLTTENPNHVWYEIIYHVYRNYINKRKIMHRP